MHPLCCLCQTARQTYANLQGERARGVSEQKRCGAERRFPDQPIAHHLVSQYLGNRVDPLCLKKVDTKCILSKTLTLLAPGCRSAQVRWFDAAAQGSAPLPDALARLAGVMEERGDVAAADKLCVRAAALGSARCTGRHSDADLIEHAGRTAEVLRQPLYLPGLALTLNKLDCYSSE